VSKPQDSPAFKDKNSPLYQKLAEEIDLSTKIDLSTDFIKLSVNPSLLKHINDFLFENVLKKD
jgi:hypothetical protein